MYTTIIVWTIVCAIAIIAYPVFLYKKESKLSHFQKNDASFSLGTVELFSFDLKKKPLGWSFTIEIPEFTDEVLYENPILFYLETEETCLKLPINNESLGYTANIFKNIGKAYLTFKCIKDGVSNYSAPICHLKSLKVMIIKPEKTFSKNTNYSDKYSINNILKAAGVNIHDYEETLEYLSNFSEIDFKGYRKNRVSLPPKAKTLNTPETENHEIHYPISI